MMPIGTISKYKYFQTRLHNALIGPQIFAFLPALILGGYWFGGVGVLLFLALAFPAAFAIAGLFSGTGPAWSIAKDRDTKLYLRSTAEKVIDDILRSEKTTGKTTAAIALALDDVTSFEHQYGSKAQSQIMKQVADRLSNTLREADQIVRLDGSRFGIVLGPIQRADLETMIQLSARLQAAIAEPFSIDATRVFITACVGFCLPSRTPLPIGSAMLEAAEAALEIAQANGSGSIRAYSSETKRREKRLHALQGDIVQALDTGQIVPWFQPQVSTVTGEITGFEALARWEDPERGLVLPEDFLPAIEHLDQCERLSEVMLYQSLAALQHWDNAHFIIPSISVNFTIEELANPKICEKIAWELDRFGLSADRLCVEILEDVVAGSKDEMVVRNIQSLAEMGCKIDLDDFGTGHASIANIRRFSVHRIKIDRSFIIRVDRDREQQNMVAAILTMAEQLEIDTLAEGVETIGEHALLARLGCGSVQGFSVAKPMQLSETDNWIAQHNAILPEVPKLGKK